MYPYNKGLFSSNYEWTIYPRGAKKSAKVTS